jgi:hypothetical protein
VGFVLIIGSVIGKNWWLWAGGGALLLWGAIAWAYGLGIFVYVDPQPDVPPEDEVRALFIGAVALPATIAGIAAGLIQWRRRRRH